ncbi:hypothetical protein [Microcoleus sp. S13C4]|uniref:hypothetical protein n=1 Tax=Microcoleus sp. S13C4 TaxID=3055410 RepID=UPI002FD40736
MEKIKENSRSPRRSRGGRWESDNSYCWVTPALPAHRAAWCESQALFAIEQRLLS